MSPDVYADLMAHSLEGRSAVVVGAGQSAGEDVGNGRAIALLLARLGAKVLVVDRDEASASETRDLILGAGGTASVMTADVAVERDCELIATTAQQRLGTIDILVNNVGVAEGDAHIEETSLDAWDRIFAVNLRGTAATCKFVLPHLRQRGSGSIVNISSIAAVLRSKHLPAYRVSKAGVNALTTYLACDYAPHGVRVNAVMPGLMRTPMALDSGLYASHEEREELIALRDSQVPLNKTMGTAWDVAMAVGFLVSDAARFITGAILPVDGGQLVDVGPH